MERSLAANIMHRVNVYRDDESLTYWAECSCGHWRTAAVHSTPRYARDASATHLTAHRS